MANSLAKNIKKILSPVPSQPVRRPEVVPPGLSDPETGAHFSGFLDPGRPPSHDSMVTIDEVVSPPPSPRERHGLDPTHAQLRGDTGGGGNINVPYVRVNTDDNENIQRYHGTGGLKPHRTSGSTR